MKKMHLLAQKQMKFGKKAQETPQMCWAKNSARYGEDVSEASAPETGQTSLREAASGVMPESKSGAAPSHFCIKLNK